MDMRRVIQGFRNLLSQAEWLAPVVSVIVVLLLGLDLIRSSSAPKPPTAVTQSVVEPSLSCQQISQIGKWSSVRYGGPAQINLRSPEFARKVADTFLDKLDPFKLVFTASESEAFKKISEQAWSAVVQGGQCGAFERWYASVYHLAHQRSLQIIAATFYDSQIGLHASEEHSVSERAPHYQTFAKNINELKARYKVFGQKVGEYTHANVLPAYHQNSQKLVVDSLQQLLFSESVEPRNLLAKSMLGAIDPFSTYLSSPEFDDFYQELAGGTSGIGIKVRKVPQGLLIEKILSDSPAARCRGLKVGATLISVDNQSLKNATVSAAKRLLKGIQNSSVKLEWVNAGSKESKSAVLLRGAFTHEEARITQRTAIVQGKPIAVVEIPTFYGRGGFENPGAEERSSSEDLEKVIKQLFNSGGKKPQALVLDLRGNPGGFLEEAVAMGGLFLGNRPVVGVVEKGSRRVLRDHRLPIYSGPLLVLMDNESASASEILAGALKDHQRAIVLGESASYGKGSVQRLFHLQDELPWFKPQGQPWNGVVKLTTSVFYSPMGHSPANGGVDPNLRLAVINHDDRFQTPPAKKTLGVPETKPFLDAEELITLHRSENAYEQALARLKKRNPWIGNADERPNNAIYYLNAEDKDTSQSTVANDELLDKAVSVASDYVLIQKSLAPKALSAVNTEPVPSSNARRVIGY